MFDLWDALPTWLQQTIAIGGYLWAIFARVWGRLPNRFTILERIEVDRRQGKEGQGSVTIIGFDLYTWGRPYDNPRDDAANGDDTSSTDGQKQP